MAEQLNIGIILGSTRPGRVSPQVGQWVKEIADKRGDAVYEILDIAAYRLPFLGEPGGREQVEDWSTKIAGLDGFVFVVQEYNHSMTGALKNALDSADYKAWNNKAAGIVSYGYDGGVRAAEHLRGVFGELQVAGVRAQPTMLLDTEFENGIAFNPSDIQAEQATDMLGQLSSWSAALKSVRG